MNENDNVNVDENDNVNVNENDNENVNDNDNVNDNFNDNDSDNDNDNANDYEIMKLNNYFKTIDKTKSFEDQTEKLKKEEYLNECWHLCYYDNNKEINLKIFKLKCAYVLIDIDENLFKEIFGHKFVALADKVINTASKEEYQIIINDIKKNKNKIYEQDDFNNFVIQPGYTGDDLLDAVKIIIDYNEVIKLDGD